VRAPTDGREVRATTEAISTAPVVRFLTHPN
jgi:hypothetical protein